MVVVVVVVVVAVAVAVVAAAAQTKSSTNQKSIHQYGGCIPTTSHPVQVVVVAVVVLNPPWYRTKYSRFP